MKEKKNSIGLQAAILLAGTIISVLIFLTEADYFEYMQGMPITASGYFLRVQYVIAKIGEELQYRGFLWGVFVPFILPMVLTILIAVVAGKIQKKAQKAEAENFAAHQVAQQEAARQTEELRQQQENLRTAQMAAAQKQQELGTAAALKAYKELLDSGVITQEDFDAKKKELLGM